MIEVKATIRQSKAPPPQPDPGHYAGALPSVNLPRGLVNRFPADGDFDIARYHLRPWLQLVDESPLEFALFTAWLKYKIRDLDTLPRHLSEPGLTDWYLTLIDTMDVPGYLLPGSDEEDEGPISPKDKDVKAKKLTWKVKKAVLPPRKYQEIRFLWWLAGHNYWNERSRAFDMWDLERLADVRRVQIQEFAEEIHKLHMDNIQHMAAVLQEVRKGVLENLISSKGLLARKKETRTMIPMTPMLGPDGSTIGKQGPVIIEMEHDPFAQLKAMYDLSDRVFGPLTSMLDGDLSAVLDKTLTLPPAVSADGRVTANGLSAPLKDNERNSANMLLERLGKVQAELEQRKLAPSKPEEADTDGK